jgi:hypothetical protein
MLLPWVRYPYLSFVRRLGFLLAGIPTESPATLVLDFCSRLVCHKYKAMKRRKFTVRFPDEEFQALTAFADRGHVIHSVAVRWLLGMALADRNPDAQRSLNAHYKIIR